MKINVRGLWRYLFFLMPFFAVCSSAYAQENGAIVECRIEYPETIKAGDKVMVTVILDIAPGFYIYAPTEMNEMQSLQIMKLSFTAPVTSIKKSGEIVMPRYGMKEAFQVYQGKNVRFNQSFKTEKEMKAGDYILKIKLVTQACDDRMCYPPVTEIKDAVISVTPD